MSSPINSSIAKVSDVAIELAAPTTDGGNSYVIFDQVVSSVNINIYLQEAASWLTQFEPQAYQSNDPTVIFIVKRLEIHYCISHLLGRMFGFIITDGHTLAINGVNQARFQAKSEGYRSVIQNYINGIPHLWAALNQLFFVSTAQGILGEGINSAGIPVSYWGYAPFA